MCKRLQIAELTADRGIESYEEARLILKSGQSSLATKKLAEGFFSPGEADTGEAEWSANDQSITELEDIEYINSERDMSDKVSIDDHTAHIYVVDIGESCYEDSWNDVIGLVTSLEDAWALIQELGYKIENIGYINLCSRKKAISREIARTNRNLLILEGTKDSSC